MGLLKTINAIDKVIKYIIPSFYNGRYVLTSHIVSAFVILSFISSSAFGVVIQGKVLDEAGAPISSALVQLYLGITPLEEFPHPVSADGKFSINISGPKLSHVTLKITAKHFRELNKTILINDKDEILVGNVPLTRLPTLKLGPMIVNESPGKGKNIFDLEISNVSNQRLFIINVDVTSVRKATTNCLDPTSKVITIDIDDQPNAKSAVIKAKNLNDSIKIVIKGSLVILPCNQMELKYTIRYGFPIEPGEHFAVRVLLPRYVWQNKVKKAVDIQNWDKKNIAFTLENGEVLMAKP